MQGFRGDVVRGKCTDRFKSYIQRAITSTQSIFEKVATVLIIDCLADLCPTLIDENNSEFKGAGMVFLDLPKVSSFTSVTGCQSNSQTLSVVSPNITRS